jgi:hypothetical protein
MWSYRVNKTIFSLKLLIKVKKAATSNSKKNIRARVRIRLVK